MSIYQSLRIYTQTARFPVEFDRNNYLQQNVKDKLVLHVGCTDFPITQQRIEEGNLLHQKLIDSAKEVVGIDLSEEGVQILSQSGFKNILVMDAENISLSQTFDIVLAGDVLEHINNPGLFVDRARSLINPGGELIIGVPSALTFNNVKAWFFGREQVHADHAFYFSPKTLSSLCARFGLLPVQLVFTVQPPGAFESRVFVLARKAILTLFRSMAPSFVMHFKLAEDVDRTKYLEWK